MGVIQIIVFSTVLTGVAVAYWFYEKKMRSSKVSRFKERPDLSIDDFYLTFYKDSGVSKNAVVGALQNVTEATGVPISKLRPTDRFD